jgi:hypothetical protein
MEREVPMTKIFNALATSMDGYITGPHLDPSQPLGDIGSPFLDWNKDSEKPSNQLADVGLCSGNRPLLSFASAVLTTSTPMAHELPPCRPEPAMARNRPTPRVAWTTRTALK